MAYITYVDTIGAAQLDNGLISAIVGGSGAASRFGAWAPMVKHIGPMRSSLLGIPYRYAFATLHGARFEYAEIPANRQTHVERVMAHLLKGGTIHLYTEDAAARVHSPCYLWPDSEPSFEMTNRREMLYTLSLSVFRSDGQQMLCQY